MSEFAVIQRLLRDAPPWRNDVIVGPGDDGAVLAVPAGFELVLTTDTLISGRHFPADTAAEDIGWKALAVNLSDLAAMAAEPAWITVALSLPGNDESWVAGFVSGLLQLLRSSGASLVGGDLTRGPLSITIQAAGLVPAGQALLRDGAQAGDLLCVTGDLGDAALGLSLWAGPAQPDDAGLAYLQARLTRPQPRFAAGQCLRGRAHAAVDISDGLAADLGHMLEASKTGARLRAHALPASPAFSRYCPQGQAHALQLTGGDDYELCFSVAPAQLAPLQQELDCKLSVIGEVVAEPGLVVLDASQQRIEIGEAGYDHFQG